MSTTPIPNRNVHRARLAPAPARPGRVRVFGRDRSAPDAWVYECRVWCHFLSTMEMLKEMVSSLSSSPNPVANEPEVSTSRTNLLTSYSLTIPKLPILNQKLTPNPPPSLWPRHHRHTLNSSPHPPLHAPTQTPSLESPPANQAGPYQPNPSFHSTVNCRQIRTMFC